MEGWEIHNGEDREAYYGSGSYVDVKNLLGNLIAMWTQDRPELLEWDQKEKLASVAFYYTDWNGKDIEGVFGVTGEGSFPGEPPWELRHPDDDQQSLKIRKVQSDTQEEKADS